MPFGFSFLFGQRSRGILLAVALLATEWLAPHGIHRANLALGDYADSLQAVRGCVTVDGRPAHEAEIVFHRRRAGGQWDAAAWGSCDGDGRFTLRSYGLFQGAPPGDCVVTIQWRPRVVDGESYLPGPNLAPDRFSHPDTTPLRATVRSGMNNLDAWMLSCEGLTPENDVTHFQMLAQ